MDKIREAIGLLISGLKIAEFEPKFMVSYYEHKILCIFLNEAINGNFVKKTDLEEMIHKNLILQGKYNYEFHLKADRASDHVPCPRAFAYALYHGAFTPSEERLIQHDGDTKISFIQLWCPDPENLPARILEHLLAKPKERAASDKKGLLSPCSDMCCDT